MKTVLLLLLALATIFLGWQWYNTRENQSKANAQSEALKSEVAELDTLLATTLPVPFLIEHALSDSSKKSKDILPLHQKAQSEGGSSAWPFGCPLCPCPNGSTMMRDSGLCCCTYSTMMFPSPEMPYFFNKDDAPVNDSPYIIRKNELFTIVKPNGRNNRSEIPRYIQYKYQGRKYEIRFGASRKDTVFRQIKVIDITKYGQ